MSFACCFPNLRSNPICFMYTVYALIGFAFAMANAWACRANDFLEAKSRSSDEEAVVTQQLSELTAEADACYVKSSSSSHDSAEYISPVATVKCSAPWWALRLAQLTSHIQPPQQPRPLNVISGCTGVSPETWALQAASRVSRE